MTIATERRVHPLGTRRALLFDLDGVLTPTADVHMRAWATLFTHYLESSGLDEPYIERDYFAYIDGKPRFDGVRSLLESRGISLPEGDPSDAPGHETVAALGNLKNTVFTTELAENGVVAYPGSVRFLEQAIAAGLEVAVVSSSRNAVPVLEAAGLRGYFTVIVDGMLAAERDIAGKPAPDTYLYAAELLGLTPEECVVVEDAHSGVEAGRTGNFGLVIGVDRGAGAQALLDSGADVVVDDLADLIPDLTR